MQKAPVIELERTRDALAREIQELIRQKNSLELSLLHSGERDVRFRLQESSESNFEENRRFFTTVVDREIHRAEREAEGRFSVMRLALREHPPQFFGDFILHTVRLADLAVRVGPRVYLVMLHRAGGLGRRLFLQRFVRSIRIATSHHQTHLTVAAGGATYPFNGDSAESLLLSSLERLKPIWPRGTNGIFSVDENPRVKRDQLSILPPEGADALASPVDGVFSALETAAKESRSGEMVAKSDDVVGRIYLHEGRVAWAHASTRRVSLTEHLIRHRGANAEEVRFAFDHCRQTGRNFAETLIELGTFDRTDMRAILKEHLANHIEAILALPTPDVMFLPQSRHYGSDLTFSLDELLSMLSRRQRIVHGIRNKTRLTITPAD